MFFDLKVVTIWVFIKPTYIRYGYVHPHLYDLNPKHYRSFIEPLAEPLEDP